MSKENEYEEEWEEEEGEPKSEDQVKDEAHLALAAEAMLLVNESIRDRNAGTFSEEIKRSHLLYNASSVDAAALMDDFEGARTAVADGSKVVQNIIRQITNDGASQLGDMLYPTDTDNWGARPLYPAKPPLSVQHEQAHTADRTPLTTEDGQPITHLQAWAAAKVAVDFKTDRMRTKIKQTLERNKFGKLGRQLINDAARTGTAILKAPYVDYTDSRRWAKGSGETYSLYKDNSASAAMSTVSVLDFLPEMAAPSVSEAAYLSVREWYLPRNMRKLAQSPKYNQTAVLNCLKNKPRYSGAEDGEGKLERLSIMDQALVEKLYKDRFEVFETWGEFSVEQLRAAGVIGIPTTAKDDSTATACVIHCDGECLRVFLNPLETGDMPFSVWCWDDDPTSMFGKGIPILAENSQLIYNAVWRMICDHGGLAAVPMVTILKDKVVPANGDKSDYSLKGGKAWNIVSDMFNLPDGAKGKPFEVHDIPIHIDQFFAIMEKAEEDAYKLTGVTRVEKNEAGVDNAPVTLGATQIFQNNASVSRRRQVRDFDDDITKDVLTRVYDFHMQHEPDEEAKVPMEIEPRGSSVLMQREVNTQNLMQIYSLTGSGAAEGAKAVDMLRGIQEGMQFPDGKFVETLEETASRRKSETENPPIDPEIALEQQKLQVLTDKNEADVEIAYMNAQTKALTAQATAEQASINSERQHYREMMKLELLSETAGNAMMVDLQSKQDAIAAKFEAQMKEIQSRRDIAAGSMLSKESMSGPDGEAKLLTAVAKKQDAETKAKEIDNKVAGVIEQGV